MSDEDVKNIIAALDRIAEGISPGPFEIFVSPLLATVAGALIAFYFAKVQYEKEERERSFSDLAKRLLLVVSDTEVACANYWSANRASRSDGEEVYLASRISSGFASSAGLAKEFNRMMPANIAASEATVTLKRFYDAGYRMATGDEFGSNSRLANPEKITAVSEYAQDVKNVLARYSIA